MKVRIHRGANEIGGSCVEVESAGERILIDAGMPLNFPPGASPALPKVDAASLRAIIISHPHLDHYGLLPWMPPVPVVMGISARRILKAAAPFMRQPPLSLSGPDMFNRKPLQIGPFCITPFMVDHSAYEAYALMIEADGRRLFYSGDFRAHGRKQSQVEQLISSPPSGIDALLLEGTTLSRMDMRATPATENDLEDEFARTFLATEGLALVHASGQNIDRLVSVYRACLRTGRTLVVDLYTAMILEATGNPRIPQSHWDGIALCIPHRQRIQIRENGWFDALCRHSGRRIHLKKHIAGDPGKYAIIFRGLWMADLDRAECLDGACLIHSQWEGYLSQERFKDIDAWRQRHGLAFHQVHTSGHASPADLRRFATALSPKVLVPIHSAVPERFESIYPHVARHADGEWWEVGASTTSGAAPPPGKRKRRRRNLQWESLVGAYEAGDYLVVPLTSSNELREEGELMNHCVGRNYHRWCHDGAVRIFSIRDLDGKRMATVSIFFNFGLMHWCLEQCKGYENREVCEISGHTDDAGYTFVSAEQSDVYFLAQDLVRLYQRAEEKSGRWAKIANGCNTD